MAYLVLALCVIVGLALMARWLLNAEPRRILRAAKWVGAIVVAAFAAFILFRGNLQGLAVTVPPLLLFLFRGRRIWQALRNAAKAARGPTPGQSTGVRTRWFAITLDHDSGAMDGEILQGPFAGRWLSDLSQQELSALEDELDGDTESRQVFEAWRDRMDPGTADAGPEEPPPSGRDDGSAMTVARAREILGVEADATDKEIREAHRRLMLANHPDHGGSSWLATQINLAKDLLLSRSS